MNQEAPTPTQRQMFRRRVEDFVGHRTVGGPSRWRAARALLAAALAVINSGAADATIRDGATVLISAFFAQYCAREWSVLQAEERIENVQNLPIEP